MTSSPLGLVVFGASGGSGQAFVSAALERGHTIRAFVRSSTPWSPPSPLEVHRGSLDDRHLLEEAVAGADAVCSFLGPRPPNTDVFCAAATQAILDAMATHGVQRFACVTGAMISASPASSISLPALFMAYLFRLARTQVAADRVAQEAIVRSSATSWTLFKPPRHPMKLRDLFRINFPVAVFFGLTCALMPALTLRAYGLPVHDAAIWVARLLGGSILGFATLMWFGGRTAAVESRRSIALALLAQDAVGFIASMEIQLRGSINALGWTSPMLYGALAVGYAYFFFVRPQDC